MPSSGLIGPFALSEDAIAAEIEPLVIGVYLVGRLNGRAEKQASRYPAPEPLDRFHRSLPAAIAASLM